MSYESFIAMCNERDEEGHNKRQRLNSGLSAFQDWEEKKVSWRKDFYNTLNDITVTT